MFGRALLVDPAALGLHAPLLDGPRVRHDDDADCGDHAGKREYHGADDPEPAQGSGQFWQKCQRRRRFGLVNGAPG